jgi:hypothetical protein
MADAWICSLQNGHAFVVGARTGGTMVVLIRGSTANATATTVPQELQNLEASVTVCPQLVQFILILH